MDKDLKNAIGVFFICLLTFGAGSIVFMYILSDRMITDANNRVIIPMREIVLTLLTAGIYGALWCYKLGTRLDMEEGRDTVSARTFACSIFSLLFLRSLSVSIIYYKMKTLDIGA